MGVGKSKLVIDTADWLHAQGKIDGLLVVAPNGVHQAWVWNEIPAHMESRHHAVAYMTHKAKNKHQLAALDDNLNTTGLAVMAMSYDGLMTDNGSKVARKFLEKRRCLYVLDEAHKIKSPTRKRTIRCLASAKYAPYRRILSGTPITNSPFDCYTQLKFLDPEFWARNGFASYEAFKTYFGLWVQRLIESSGVRFPQLVEYRHLDQLKEIIAPIATRLTKKDNLNLPPKSYVKRYFELTPEQVRAYDQLKEELLVEWNNGKITSTPLAITLLLRLQQVICGYLPSDDGTFTHRFTPNSRLASLMDLVEEVPHQGIIYARFKEDISQICEALGGGAYVRYDGSTGPEERQQAVDRFQAGGVKWFVGNPAACGMGLTLTKAQTVVYYSNNFSLEQRLQSEDRAHRIGQTNPVTYVDLIARDGECPLVDDKIVEALRNNRDVASEVTGENVGEWI